MYERILECMTLKGIRYVKDLERQAGLSNGTIRNIRYGHMPTSEKLSRIADVLGVSTNYLLTGIPDIDPLSDPVSAEVYHKRMAVLSLLEGLSPESYNIAIDYLVYLKAKEEKK